MSPVSPGELAVVPPVAPMLAKAVAELPVAEGLWYEPKWDGFRCIAFVGPDGVELGSRNERPLTRYFPEVVEGLAAQLPVGSVVDGEIVIMGDRGLDFGALLQRIHPAASRVAMLAGATPAALVAFDLLATAGRDLRPEPFSLRRRLLEEVASAPAGAPTTAHLTPGTTDPAVAADWFDRFEGAGLDGVVAKSLNLPYRENERVMFKVKHQRVADCVVGGYREHKNGGVGSLLLGLHDGDGVLRRVGVCSSFTAARRRELVAELEPLRMEDPAGHPWHGLTGEGMAASPEAGHSRWNAGRDLSWVALRPELVVEVAYDHLQGERFRHATQFRRWRPDRQPGSCRFSQLEVAAPAELSAVLAG